MDKAIRIRIGTLRTKYQMHCGADARMASLAWTNMLETLTLHTGVVKNGPIHPGNVGSNLAPPTQLAYMGLTPQQPKIERSHEDASSQHMFMVQSKRNCRCPLTSKRIESRQLKVHVDIKQWVWEMKSALRQYFHVNSQRVVSIST